MVITWMFTSTSQDRVQRGREIDPVLLEKLSFCLVLKDAMFCVVFFEGNLCMIREIQLTLQSGCSLSSSISISVFYLKFKKLYSKVTGAYFYQIRIPF